MLKTLDSWCQSQTHGAGSSRLLTCLLCPALDILTSLQKQCCIYTRHNTLYSYFKKGCRKKCTRQSRKVLWVVFSSLFFKQISKNGKRGHGRMFASAKGKQQKQIRQPQCQEKCIDHIPYNLSGLSHAQVFRQPFSKQLYN